MIHFLSPGFAWALAAPALILVLYLLRRRYLPRQVPSVFLWRKSVKDYAVNRPFQKLMKNLLLPLQILAALALALALMRPAIPGGTAGRTVLIFDVSGSMQAETEGRTRLETAKEEALALIRTLPAEEKITVLAAGAETERLALSAEREEAEKAVASVTCGRAGADIVRALALADAIAREGEEETGANTVVYSDTFRRSQAAIRGGAFSLSIVNCGAGGENRAVYSLEAADGQAFARVMNYGEDCSVSLTCEADGVLCDAREAEIPAGESVGIGFSIPEGARRVRVSLREKDALAADNTAEAAVKHAVARTVAVTSDSVFLESALRVRSDLTVVRTEEKALASTEADLYILGTSPLIVTRTLPEEGYNPEATAFGPFSWAAEETAVTGSPATVISENPLTKGLTMKDVFFRSIRPVSGGKAAATLDGQVVVAYAEGMAALGFDLHNSNLPLKYDFPVLIQNMLDWLLPAGTETEETTEALMPLEESDVRTVAPDDAAEDIAGRSDRGQELTAILLAAFLVLMLAEMGVARYVG
ncbi:MAG: BatA and WFA domain-containing protein [Clostridia bacterium]|nr:BatA and WFA domain-containing protein [Clostridia bacterium]